LKVDLTGQVATDSIAHKFYGGIWSDDDSIRGARFSKGGKPIVVLASKSLQGRSNIVFELPPGTGVSITRSDVEYVVTEYGTAYLYGKSIRERCLTLIEIAHPDFRQNLLAQAKAKRYISQSQPGRSFGSIYPAELECLHATKQNKSVFVRPIKVADEDHLRDFFYKLSDHSVYLRYFRKLKSMPQRILQKTADVDYSTEMALVVLSPPDTSQNELVAIGHWVSDPRGGLPEIAFQVRDDWQGEGLGTYLFQRLVEIAKTMGLPKLKADVLADNKGMNVIFEHSGVPSTRTSDFGVITYTFDLQQELEKQMPN
jgi:GNAT superfamily N-acetyltransferase